MSKLPASAGLTWIREGFAIFRKQPGGLMLLMLAFLLAAAVLSFIPLLGSLLQVVMAPVFTALFMQACAAIEANQRLTPDMLRPIFQKPALPRLTGLGSLYLLVFALLALVIIAIVGADVIEQLARQKLSPQAAAASNFGWAMLAAFLLSLPISMAILFAPPLVYWHQMGVGKSLFYSFFAVWRALRPFAVFFVGWLVIFMLASNLVMLLAGSSLLGRALMQSLWMVIGMVVQCSAFAAYRAIFGAPAQPEAADVA